MTILNWKNTFLGYYIGNRYIKKFSFDMIFELIILKHNLFKGIS